MNTYSGIARVLLADDFVAKAAADLSKDDVGTWRGTLTFQAAVRTPDLLNLTEGTLRIDGSDGKFVRPDTSDWANSPMGLFRIRIEGNGDAPF